jgi:hypothetical protein
MQLCKDLRMPTEEKDYSEQLKKLEKINALMQRDSDSTQVRRSAFWKTEAFWKTTTCPVVSG